MPCIIESNFFWSKKRMIAAIPPMKTKTIKKLYKEFTLKPKNDFSWTLESVVIVSKAVSLAAFFLILLNATEEIAT
jgi:hypothetical protein